MRDLIVAFALFGILVGVGCGVARAQRAESPNYSLEYLEETNTPAPDVRGEQATQFDGEQQTQPAPTTELPATNPPYVLVGAIVAGIAIAVIAYFALK